MIDPKEELAMRRIEYFAREQIKYINEYPSCWGYGEHRMAQYMLSPFRRIRP